MYEYLSEELKKLLVLGFKLVINQIKISKVSNFIKFYILS